MSTDSHQPLTPPPITTSLTNGPTDSEEETHPQTQIRAHNERAPRWTEKELFPVEIVPQHKAHRPGHRASRVGPLQRSEPSPRSGLSGGGTSGFTLTRDGEGLQPGGSEVISSGE